MTSILQATTELEAVNVMLSNIGESPVNSLNDQDVVDAGVAHTILLSMNREVQSSGWWFNTDFNRKFLPNTENKIALPVNILRVDTSGRDRLSKNLVQRGKYLYDPDNHTFNISTPVILTVVVGLSFEDIPETARRFITLRASRVFQERIVGAPSISHFNEKDEANARAALIAEDVSSRDHNMLTDSVTVQRTLNRHHLFSR